jgi:hypothetical protein
MIIKNNKNKLIRHQAATCFFVLLLVGSFFVGSSTKAALLGNYNKATSSTLRADEWNNLFKDFLSTIGGVVSGAVGINTPTSSSYILDVNGSIRGTTITGSYLGTLNAANVSSGQFGANIGGGNFSFPGNVGVGVTNPLTKIDVSGGAIRTDGQFISTVGYGTAPLSVISTTTVANLSANYLGFGSVGATPSISPYSKLTAGIITLPEFSNSEAGTITVRGWNSSYYSWQIIGNNTPWNRPDLYFRTGPDGSWGTTYKLWHSGNLTSGLATSSVVKWNGSSLANSLIYDNGTALGVGTTNPSQKLTISLNQNSPDGLLVENTNGGTEAYALLKIMTDGGEAHRSAVLKNSSTKTAYGGAHALSFYQFGPDPISFVTNNAGTPQMILSGSGNVGIGTTTPTSKLTLSGGDLEMDNNTSIKISSSTGNTTLLIGNYADGQGFGYGASSTRSVSLAVEGNVKANQICIREDCKSTWTEIVNAGGGTKAVYVGATPSSVTGDNSGVPGYIQSYALCETAYPGSHVCTPDDMLSNIKFGTKYPSTNVWIFAGPPGYIASANDCGGRTKNLSTSLGAYWEATTTEYVKGRGFLMECNKSLNIACCN